MDHAIFHLANVTDAENLAETGLYHTASLDSEGFIHCCTAKQMSGVIQRYYSGASELVVLAIDAAKLDPKLVFENTSGGEELFPHVYGKINQSAVSGIEKMDKGRIKDIASTGHFSGLN